MTSIDNPNTIITTITKQLPNPVILTDIDTSCICFDTSNQRIGINTLNPTCALDIHNGIAKINRPFGRNQDLSDYEIVIWGDISGRIATGDIAFLGATQRFTGANTFTEDISYFSLTGGNITSTGKIHAVDISATNSLSVGGQLNTKTHIDTCGNITCGSSKCTINAMTGEITAQGNIICGAVDNSCTLHHTDGSITCSGLQAGGGGIGTTGGVTCLHMACNDIKITGLPTTGQATIEPYTDCDDNVHMSTWWPTGIGSNGKLKSAVHSDGLWTVTMYNQSTQQLYQHQSTSDRKLKTNITPFVRKLDIVKQLNPVYFQWIETSNNDYGFIAQELEVLIPGVITNKNDDDGEITKVYTHEATLHFIPILTKAIQDLDEDKNKEILDLSNEVIELKTENYNLKARVSTLESENTTLKFQMTDVISRLEVLENQV